jgi:hypothetical protein
MHLCMTSGTSPFVSISSSLVQSLVKASAMRQPRIALIALDHPTLTAPHKLLHAKTALRKLKPQGQASWARYRGNAEFMAWAEIDHSSIISDTSLADIIKLYDHDEDIYRLLHLHVFTPGSRTLEANRELRKKNITINTALTAAMGCGARIMLRKSKIVSLQHIVELIARLHDGWGFIEDLSQDSAYAFAKAFESDVYEERDLARAYLDGATRGGKISSSCTSNTRGNTRRTRRS